MIDSVCKNTPLFIYNFAHSFIFTLDQCLPDPTHNRGMSVQLWK